MPSVRLQMFRKEEDGGRKEAKRLVRKAENKWQGTSVLRGRPGRLCGAREGV